MIADPLLQAVLAFCSHPKYVADCDPCEVRRGEALRILAEMAERALGRR